MQHRWAIASRILAGTIGAYGLTSLMTVAVSLVLVRTGMDKVEAVTAATLASFATFAIIAMMAFHARRAVNVWAGLALAAVPVGLILFLMMPGASG